MAICFSDEILMAKTCDDTEKHAKIKVFFLFLFFIFLFSLFLLFPVLFFFWFWFFPFLFLFFLQGCAKTHQNIFRHKSVNFILPDHSLSPDTQPDIIPLTPRNPAPRLITTVFRKEMRVISPSPAQPIRQKEAYQCRYSPPRGQSLRQ